MAHQAVPVSRISGYLACISSILHGSSDRSGRRECCQFLWETCRIIKDGGQHIHDFKRIQLVCIDSCITAA